MAAKKVYAAVRKLSYRKKMPCVDRFHRVFIKERTTTDTNERDRTNSNTKGVPMRKSQDGDTVKVHYTGKVKDGEVFDSSREREPLEVTIGQNQVIPGFENALKDLSVGETRQITLAPEDAYGPYREDMIVKVDRSRFPENVDPQIGQRFQVQSADGSPLTVMVKDTADDGVTLDANHPLAGKDLEFDLEMVEIG
jgi:FKBP-type peptidyl-prolyl cis-trans isomerase 2